MSYSPVQPVRKICHSDTWWKTCPSDLKGQIFRLQPWLWNLKHPPSAMVWGQTCPPKEPSSDQAGAPLGNTSIHAPGVRPTVCSPNWGPDRHLCSRATHLDKALEAFPFIQGPDKIHATRVPVNRPTDNSPSMDPAAAQTDPASTQHDDGSRGNPSSSGNWQEKLFTC